MKTSYNSILRPGKGGGATLLFVLLLLSGVFVLSAVNKLAGKFYFYATITVDDDGMADHTSIQAAIDAASAGDVIEVADGNYEESINLNKAVTIRGANADIAAGASPGTRIAETTINGGFIVSAAATLNGLKIINGRSSGSVKVGVAVASSNVTILNCIIEDVGLSVSQSDGISTQPGNNALTLTNSTIKNNWRGIYLNPGGDHTFTGNLVDANNGVGVGIGSDGQSNFTLTGNVISNNTLEGWGSSAVGVNVLAKNNQFLNNGVSIAHYGGSQINANLNYWGADAPAAGVVSGDVNIDSWWKDAAYTMLGTVQPVVNVTQNTVFATIQAAINAAAAGDVIQVDPGTYKPTTTLRVDKALTIQGAGSGTTTIDVGGYNAWGVYISASNVTFSGFTIQGDAAANQQFAFKVGTGNSNPPNATTNFINEGLTVNDLVVQGTKRTGIDLNGVRNATLSNITSTGATGGFGMSISSSQQVTVSNITTSGNAWGDVGIFPANSPFQFPEIASPSGIVFSGTVNLSSGSGSISVQNGALQSGGTWVGTISNDPADNADVTVPVGFTHVVNATRNSDGLVSHNVGTQSAIHALAKTLAGSGSYSGTTVDNLDNDMIEVLEGLSIQAAIDAASSGDEIQVAAGTYAGFTIPSSKSGLKLFGANEGTPGGGTRGPVSLVEGAVLINANGVTIDGFDIIGTNVDQTPALSKRGILVGNQASQTNVSILNNIIQDWVTGISLAGGGKFPWGQNIEIKGNLLVNNGIGSTENVDQLTIQDNNFNNSGIGLGGGCVLAAPISGNHFSNGGASTRYFSAADGVDLINGLSGIMGANTFDKAVSVNDATGSWYKQAIFTTFSGAINASASGAEIMAAAGEYPSENIALKDNLTIKGAQAGNDARLRGQTEKGETVIVGTGRIFNLASGVTLDGLYFRDLRHRGMDEAGKVVNDFTIKNSVLLSSAGSYQGGAIQIAPTTANNFTFENNYVANRGGYLLYFGPGGTFGNGTIKNNYINSHGLMFGPFNEASGWVISGNHFDGTIDAAPYEGYSINAQFGNVQLANNKFEKQRSGPQISVIGGSITDNDFLDNKNYGVELWGGAWGSPVSTNVVISGNKFTYNGIPGSTEGTTSRAIRMGRFADSPGIDFGTISVTNNSFVNLGNVPNAPVIERIGTGTLNATCNWWGSATASFTSSITAGITYAPFLTNGTDNSPNNGFQNSSPCNGTLSAWCSDGIQSGNETGVDCGGDCIACPTCDDGIQNQGEIGIDCGGPCGICELPVFVNPPADASIPYANAAGVTFASLSYSNGQTGGCAITGSVQPLVSRSFGICGGTITATWNFLDKCNRTVTYVQTLTVLPLPAASWVNPPQNITITCKEFLENYTTPLLNYSNGLSGNNLISGLVPGQREVVADVCGTGFTETWSFTDFCGRNATHTRFVTVTATCDDGIQNQGETGVDCGGPNCAACPTCERPTGLYVNGIVGNSATFNWTRVANAVTYSLQIRPLGNVNWTTVPSVANKITLGGLVPNQSYEWRVLADCDKLDSDWSPTCQFTANVPESGNCDAPENGPTCADGIQNQGEGGVDCGGPCDTACPTCDDGIQNQGEEGIDCGGPCTACPPEVCVAPTGLEAIIDPSRARNVDLVWDVVPGAISYEFSYRAAGSEAWITFPRVSTNAASIGALREGQTYEWRVKTICSKSESGYSLVCSFTAGQAGSSSCEPLVPTCEDGIQNQGEEGIDCGGPCASCPTCEDGIQNQGETGVDCGGPCTPCPTCNDGIQNQGETGIDCGGPCEPCPPPACDAPTGLVATTFGRSNLAIVNWGLTANAESYLLSWRKVGNSNWNEIELSEANYRFINLEINDSYEWRVRSVCGLYQGAPLRSPWSAICAFTTGIFNEGCTIIAPTCEDGIQNQGETGVDCGGPCTPCPTCNDGIQNQGETGIDCGGPCTPCPTCDDGIQNGDETGVDCGGENCAPCETCEDGIQNQDEEGIDCGGENCAPCDCPAPVLLEVFISRGVDPDSLYWDAVSNAVAYKVEWRVTGAEVWNELDVTTNGVSGAVLNLIDGEMYEWRVRTICYFDTDINFYSTICFFTSNVPGSVYCDEESSCEDGIQNQGEEGIDCGGPCVPCASCEDGIQNQDEEGIDCGGSCEPCATCEDGIQNQDEEGIDCGGTSCIPCETCTDGVQNQGEEGVDCGGPCGACPECEVPTGLDFERFGKLNMRVFWNEVTDATRYQIRLRILDSDTWTVANLTKTTYTASRLTLGAIYEWQVKTICGDLDLESEWSDVQYFMAGESGTIVPGGLTGLTTDKELLRVFPVPTSNLLNVSLNHEAISGVKLSLMDMTGNTVLVMPIEQGTRSVQLNVGNLPRGIYFIKAEHETAVKVLRVVLQ